MFAIPLYVFAIVYVLFLLIFLLFSFANVYHIVSTATFTFPVVLTTTFTVLWCIGILVLTFWGISEANWSASMVFLGPGGIVAFE